MLIKIPKDSRTHEILETYIKIHGQKKGDQLDNVVFLMMSLVAFKTNAAIVAETNPSLALVLNVSVDCMLSALIDLCKSLGIDKLDLIGMMSGLTKDIGESHAQPDQKAG